MDKLAEIKYRAEQDWAVRNNVGIGASERCFKHRWELITELEAARSFIDDTSCPYDQHPYIHTSTCKWCAEKRRILEQTQ